MPAFVRELRQRQGIAALAFEFLILCGTRSADVLGAKRAHINRAEARWDIPQFSKTHRPHRVPLSRAALAILDKVEKITGDIGGKVGASEYLFPNDVTGAALSVNALLSVINRMGFKGRMTAHGCRASFRTWAQELTSYPWELCELSLGHAVGNKVERAYARGDGLKKRIAIMESWSRFLSGQAEESGKILEYARADA
jgi:integrase